MHSKITRKKRNLPYSLVPLMLVLSGCLGSTGETVALHPQNDGGDENSLPFVEAILEYPGPQEKWAGPQNFIIHLNTKSVGRARVEISTSIFKPHPHGEGQELKPVTYGLTPEAAREQIARLALALKEPESPVQGCLLPIKIRLIRADGVIVTREGCRGQKGWPRVASEMTSHLIESAIASKSDDNLASPSPGVSPSPAPSTMPSVIPSVLPSVKPSPSPVVIPSAIPSVVPMTSPSPAVSATPSPDPSPGSVVSPSPTPKQSASPGPLKVIPSPVVSIIPEVQPSPVLPPSPIPELSAKPK